MMRKLFVGVLVMTLIFGGIGVVSAFGGPGGNMSYGQQNVQKPYYNQQNVNPLNLSEEQEEKLEDVQENYWNEVKDILTDEQIVELEEGNFGMGLNNNFNNTGAYGPGMRRSRPGQRGPGYCN